MNLKLAALTASRNQPIYASTTFGLWYVLQEEF
jgi:hypothetical protein